MPRASQLSGSLCAPLSSFCCSRELGLVTEPLALSSRLMQKASLPVGRCPRYNPPSTEARSLFPLNSRKSAKTTKHIQSDVRVGSPGCIWSSVHWDHDTESRENVRSGSVSGDSGPATNNWPSHCRSKRSGRGPASHLLSREKQRIREERVD